MNYGISTMDGVLQNVHSFTRLHGSLNLAPFIPVTSRLVSLTCLSSLFSAEIGLPAVWRVYSDLTSIFH